mmetsp:Transcript_34812/g.109355  ORF Transcript_34812/g.109355 Transcript_34812/m.109355 type:complete len:96 (-) Transcript_34812:112-399(-)|eukprot:CAMPEP_0175293782 /NCGR_PEP_ID=MMETSP0093-20121207/57647_1 /TAXON_ID=311494 /ORGANISM="Alexandrium monilatum, Strain CCMP3105" /LENGTH=95 /DNA_ID=CAMNT_0016589671 /DNA_START=13 /DNA_END=300 /DNA_ORIENTATION=+
MSSDRPPQYAGMVKVELWDGIVEEVYVDEKTGPKVLRMDGTYIDWRTSVNQPDRVRASEQEYGTGWDYLTSTKQKVVLHLVAKVNRKMKERYSMV